MRTRYGMTALLLAFVGFAGTAGAEDTKDSIKQRLEARSAELIAQKQAGKIGETNLGKVDAVKAEYLNDATVKKIVADENADRDKLYALIAKEQSTADKQVTIEQVARHAAIVKFKKAGMDEYFRAKDGKWYQKKDLIKKAQEKQEE